MKKLLTIIALSLVGLLGATVITLAFVKTDYDQLNTSGVEAITVLHSSKENTFYSDTNEEVFNKLLAEYEKGTRESVLSSLFQGAYSADAKPEVLKLGWILNNSATYLKLSYEAGSYPTITLNGKEYTDENLTTTNKTVEYKAVYLEVENTTTLTKITAYFVETLNNTSNNSGNYKIQFVTRQSSLHSYIVSLYENDMLF